MRVCVVLVGCDHAPYRCSEALSQRMKFIICQLRAEQNTCSATLLSLVTTMQLHSFQAFIIIAATAFWPVDSSSSNSLALRTARNIEARNIEDPIVAHLQCLACLGSVGTLKTQMVAALDACLGNVRKEESVRIREKKS